MSVEHTPRFGDRLFGMIGVRLIVWMVVAMALLPGLFHQPYQLADFMDDHGWYSREDQSRISLVEHHQLFAWNPYTCGGIPGIANPEETSLSPDFLLRILWGTGPGRRLSILLFLVLGMEGVYRLLRKYDTAVVGAAFGAITFALNSRFMGIIPLGWLHFFGFELIPWVLLGFVAGIEKPWWRVLGGVFLAWMLLCAGTYAVPYTVIALTVYLVVETGAAFGSQTGARPIAPWKPLASYVTLGAVAVGLSAAKLFPVVQVALERPRLWLPNEYFPPARLISELITPWALPLLVLALVAPLMRDRVAARFLVFAAFFFALSMGDFGRWSPYAVMRKLPFFGQLRAPDRFMIFPVMFVCMAAGRMIGHIEDAPTCAATTVRAWYRRIRGRAPGDLDPTTRFVLGALGVGLALRVGYPMARDYVLERGAERHAELPPPQPRLKEGDIWTVGAVLYRPGPFRAARGNRWDTHVWPALNLSTIQCFVETPFPQSPLLRGDLPAEEYPLDPTLATVERAAWSPNRIDLRVTAKAPTRVLVNQNWHRAWRSGVGAVVSHEGLLAVDVPAGEHVVTLRYLDSVLLASLGVSILTAGGLLVLASRAARRSEAYRRWSSMPWIARTAGDEAT